MTLNQKQINITERDIYDFKIYKSFKDYVPKVFFNVIKDLYYKHENSKEGTLSLSEFLNIIQYTSKKMLPDDILNLRFNYSNDSNETYLDVNKCFSIILVLKDSKTKLFENKLALDIYNKVVEVKNIRNDLVKRSCETQELHKFKDKLITGINFICNTIPNLYPSSKDVANKYNNLKEKFNSLVIQLWKEKLNENEPSFIELLKNAENDKFKQFVKQCREQVIDKYKKLNESSPLIQGRFQFNIDTMFIEPILKDKEASVSYKKIFVRKLRNQKTDPPVIIISADAGYGKTTLCRKLTLEWCSSVDETYEDKFDLLLLIEVRKATEDGLYQYLKEILLRNFLHDFHATEEETILFLQQLKLLVIIDAYDEKSREAQKLINSLLEFLADKKIIITTRPHFMRQITNVLRDKNLQYLDLNLKGFKDSKEYIKKVWRHLKTEDKSFKMNIENFLSFRNGLPEDFKKLTYVPLINFLLIYLWINSKKPLKNLTFTSLYVQIFNLQKETIMKKIIQNVEEKNSNDVINKIINNFFETLFEKCYSQLIKRKEMSSHCIEEMKPYLNDELKKHQMNSEYPVIFFSTVFTTSRNLRNLDNIKILQYEFLHKTQFEYFVACHASNLLCKDGPTTVKDLEIFNEKNFMNNINEFSFLLGILNEKGVLESFADSITDSLKYKITDDFDCLWKLLSETMNDHSENDSYDFKPNDKLCEYYREKLLKGCWRLLDRNVISGLRILCYADFKPEEIIIDLCDNPNNIVSFEQNFSSMIRSLNKCGGKKITMEIHFHSHKKKSDNNNEIKSSDLYLSYLSSNRILNMQKFTGCIEKVETISLDTFKNLVRIEVRVSSIPVLEELIKACNNNNGKLKWIVIIFDEPFVKKTANKLPQLNILNQNSNICIVYNNVKDIHLAIENLVKMKPRDRLFFSVHLDISTTEESPREWLLMIHKKRLIDDKLTVRASYDVEESEQETLKKKLHFELKWNE